MLYLAFLRVFFGKEKGKYTVTLINRCSLIPPAFSINGCSTCIANCIRRRFLITQFLATKALGKNIPADRR